MTGPNAKQKAFAVLYARGESAEKAYAAVYGKGRKRPLSEAACCDGAAGLLGRAEVAEYAASIEKLLYARSTEETLRKIFMEIALSEEVSVGEKLKAADGLAKLDNCKNAAGGVTLHFDGMEKFLG